LPGSAGLLGSGLVAGLGVTTGDGDLVDCSGEGLRCSLRRDVGFAVGSGGGGFALSFSTGGWLVFSANLYCAFGVSASVTGGAFSVNVLLRCCFALFRSESQVGCDEGGGEVILGLSSGLFRADSSQLDLVGLHLFEGLEGCADSLSVLCTLRNEATDFERV
jgi:hypothetical protein